MLLLVNFELFHGIFTNFLQLFLILWINFLLDTVPIFFSWFFNRSLSLWSWIWEFLVVEFFDWSLCNFQFWAVFPWSLRFLFFYLSWSVLLMVSINCSFIHVCPIYKNICFSWLNLIFGIILNCWLEYLLILIKVLCALWFLNIILVNLWIISRVFSFFLSMYSRNLLILLLWNLLMGIIAHWLGSLIDGLWILIERNVLRSCLRILLSRS